jgi:hypothetical protein
MDLFPPSGDGEGHLPCGFLQKELSSDQGQLCRYLLPSSPEEGDRPVSETLRFLVFRISDDGQSLRPSNAECYIPYRIYWNTVDDILYLYMYKSLFLFKNYNVDTCKIHSSAVGTATAYGLDNRRPGVRVPVGSRIFTSSYRPDRLWGPRILLSNGYQGQRGRSQVRDPMMWMNFFNLTNPSSRTRPGGLLSIQQKWVPEAEK